MFLLIWTDKVTEFAGQYDGGLTRLDGEVHLVVYCNLPLRDEGQKGPNELLNSEGFRCSWTCSSADLVSGLCLKDHI